jgi:hypothetical protein
MAISKRDKDAHTKMLTKATCTFVVEDVLDMFDVTEDEAEEFLFNNRKHIEDRMCERGWQTMECFGEMDGLKRKDALDAEAIEVPEDNDSGCGHDHT